MNSSAGGNRPSKGHDNTSPGETRLPTGRNHGNNVDQPAKPEASRPAAGSGAGEGTRVVPGGTADRPSPHPPEEEKSPRAEDAGATRLSPKGPPHDEGESRAPEGIERTRVAAPGEKSAARGPSDHRKEQAPPPGGPPGEPPEHPTGKQDEPDDELERLRKALSGKYEITRKLGSGGMANVYHAREIALQREVAIKVLPQSLMRDKQFVTRFKREAQVAANLEHPHIVRIYQIGEEKDLVYFVMSYIPGGSLTDQIKKHGTLPTDRIVQWGMDVCSALGYAHDHGVIHRDLKPDNIMLDKSGRAVVMDFGIARAGQGTGLTQTGAVIGTPQFMSPEQARGIELDSRSDIYSMGLVLYQMATGSLPFEARDAASLMYMHVHEAPEPPDVRNPDVPAWLRDIILKCLAKNPEDRFSTAKELRLALAEHKAPEITEKTIIQKRRAEEKRRLGIWLAAAFVLAAAAVSTVFFFNSRREPPEQVSRPVEAPAEQPAGKAPGVDTDDLTFQQAEMTNTKQAFLTYLEKYPDGKHAPEAKEKIAAFEEEERKAEERRRQEELRMKQEQERLARERQAEEERRRAEAERRDDEAFRQAESTGTVEAYTLYLTSYPLGRHVEEARKRIADLNEKAAAERKAREEELARREDEAFRLAMETNTKEAYTGYLISYPTGRHAAEAKAKIAAIEEREAFNEKIRIALSELSINMVDVPGGTFKMGSNNGGKDERPVRTVTVTGFSMSATEITQGQYKAVMHENPSFHKLDDNLPVEKVTWKDAAAFCNKLSERLGLEPCYDLDTGKCDFGKNGFRLPTEAEWEYACRAGTGSDYNIGSGESALARAGWYAGNSGERTHAVGQKTPNGFGLYDMHGNVWEWTNDWYSERSYEIDTETSDPKGVPGGRERVLRGGSWLDFPKDCTSSRRRKYNPDKNYSDIGFRIVRR